MIALFLFTPASMSMLDVYDTPPEKSKQTAADDTKIKQGKLNGKWKDALSVNRCVIGKNRKTCCKEVIVENDLEDNMENNREQKTKYDC